MAGHERPDCRNDIEEKDQQESGRVVALSGHKASHRNIDQRRLRAGAHQGECRGRRV